MSTNLKITKFTAIVSGISFFAAFAICLNISYEWFNIKWLPNDFLLAVFCGVFASTLVVFICEIQKYHLNKHQAENAMHTCCTEMSSCFISAKKLLTQLVDDKNKLATENLLTPLCQVINYWMNSFFCIDYTTCCKKQSLFKARKDFDMILIDTVQKTVCDCKYFEIAVIEAKIKNEESGKSQYLVNTNDITILDVTNALINEFNICIESLTAFMKKIDYSGRFQIGERFSNVEKSQANYKPESLEDFLKRNSQ